MQNLISYSIEQVGLGPLAAGVGVSYQALRKWEANGRLPRTEFTGETDYAGAIAHMVGNGLTRETLLAWSLSAYQERRAA